jgi:hypothetical protein
MGDISLILCYNENMVISFFGHADYFAKNGDEDKILSFLESLIKGESVEFFLGGYGRFDAFSLRVSKRYKMAHKNATIIFVTPYNGDFIENRKQYLEENFDDIIYPPLEIVPKKLAILKRNEWIVDNSDISIFYVVKNYGGAYSTLEYAKRKNKKFITNLLK